MRTRLPASWRRGPAARSAVSTGIHAAKPSWIIRRPKEGGYYLEHSGGNNGYNASYARYPVDRVAIIVLTNRGAVDALMVAVKDPNKDVREQVVFALGQIRDPRAIDALTTALKDQSPDVRRQAAFALGQLAR